jgi:hypothetical protein
MAVQWLALPKLFPESINNGYQVVKDEPEFIQFFNDQSWTFKGIHKTARVTGLVSLSLDPKTIDSDFIQVVRGSRGFERGRDSLLLERFAEIPQGSGKR